MSFELLMSLTLYVITLAVQFFYDQTKNDGIIYFIGIMNQFPPGYVYIRNFFDNRGWYVFDSVLLSVGLLFHWATELQMLNKHFCWENGGFNGVPFTI